MLRKTALCLVTLSVGCWAADPELLKLAMPNARLLAGASVAQVKNSPFGQFLLRQSSTQSQRDLEGIIGLTGFDPRRDVEEVLFATPGGPDNQQKLLLVRGTFKPDQIAGAAKNFGAEIASYQGVDIISAPPGRRGGAGGPSGTPKAPGALAILGNTIAIAGDPESVRGAIDRNRAGGMVVSPAISSQIGRLTNTYDAWFLSLVPFAELAAHAPNASLGGPLKGDALKAIDQASGGVKFLATVNAAAELVARSAQDASSLADVFRFLLSLAQMGQPNISGLDTRALLSSAKIDAQGQKVTVGVAIPESQLESLVLSGQHTVKP